jgi:hypothetical protein
MGFLQWHTANPNYTSNGLPQGGWFEMVKSSGQDIHDQLMGALPLTARRDGKLVYCRAALFEAGSQVPIHIEERPTGNYHLVLAMAGDGTLERFDLDGAHRFTSKTGTGYMFDGTNVRTTLRWFLFVLSLRCLPHHVLSFLSLSLLFSYCYHHVVTCPAASPIGAASRRSADLHVRFRGPGAGQ